MKRATPAGAWAAIITGVLSGILLSYWKQIVGLFIDTNDFSFVLIQPLSVFVSLTTGILVSAVTNKRSANASSLGPNEVEAN